MELELEKYQKLIKDPHVLKFVDNDKLADLVLDYNPTLEDVELYMQTLTLYVRTTSFKFDAYRILYAIERCKKVSDSYEKEIINDNILEYSLRLFGLFLEGVSIYSSQVFNSIIYS